MCHTEILDVILLIWEKKDKNVYYDCYDLYGPATFESINKSYSYCKGGGETIYM